MKVYFDKKKIAFIMARKKLKFIDLKKKDEFSTRDWGVIIRRGRCTPRLAGDLADLLEVDVSEILEDAVDE